MQAFIAKPFTTEILLSSIQKILVKKTTMTGTTNSSTIMQKTLNFEILSTLKEVMEDDFIELIPAFFESSDQILTEFKDALSNKDFEIMQRNVHSLKSSSANLGAMNLSSMAQDLEQQCKNKIVVSLSQLEAIENEYTCVKQALLDFSAE